MRLLSLELPSLFIRVFRKLLFLLNINLDHSLSLVPVALSPPMLLFRGYIYLQSASQIVRLAKGDISLLSWLNFRLLYSSVLIQDPIFISLGGGVLLLRLTSNAHPPASLLEVP